MGIFDGIKTLASGDAASDNDVDPTRRRFMAGGIAAAVSAAVPTSAYAANRNEANVYNFTNKGIVRNPKLNKSGILLDGTKPVEVVGPCGVSHIQVSHNKVGSNIRTLFKLVAQGHNDGRNARFTIHNRVVAEANMDESGLNMYFEYNRTGLEKKWIQNGVVHPDSDILRMEFEDDNSCNVRERTQSQDTPTETQRPPETERPTERPPETERPTEKPPETSPPETSPPETSPPETSPPETSPPETSPPETSPPEPELPGGGCQSGPC